MGKYACEFTNFSTTTGATTAVSLEAAAAEQGEVIEIIMTGAGVAAPADRAHRAQGDFLTFATAGTGTALTEVEFDERSQSALLAGVGEYSAEPTTYAAGSAVLFAFNQRGGMRWAVPRGEGVMVRGGDTNDGFGLRVISDAAGAVDGQVHFWEP